MNGKSVGDSVPAGAIRSDTLLFGISMGGLGSLRLGFQYPDRFLALSAPDPGIDAAVQWKDVKPGNSFWRAPEAMRTIFGKPFDETYWEANYPASLNLHEATEFLHRILWDNQVLHEYHPIRGAEHVGRALNPRSIDGLAFLGRMLNPPGPDPKAEATRKTLAPLRKKAGVQ